MALTKYMAQARLFLRLKMNISYSDFIISTDDDVVIIKVEKQKLKGGIREQILFQRNI